MKELEKEIQNKDFRRAYLIYGPEDLLRQKCKNRLIQALGGPEDPNFTYREGAATDEEEIRLLAGTVPFLSEKRLILLENTGWAKKGGGQALAGDLENLPDSTVLVLVEKEADAKSSLFKAVKAQGRCIACEPLGEADLKRSLKAFFEEAGYAIDGQSLEYLISRCGTDLATLSTEREKLLAYCLDSKTIRPEDIDAITHQTLRDRIFDMVDAMAAGKPREAFRLYEDLKALKEPPAKILGLILSQATRLYVLRELDERGLSQKEMADITRYHPYVIKKSMAACRAYPSRIWRRKWEQLLTYDHAFRSGKMQDVIAVELALVEMSLR